MNNNINTIHICSVLWAVTVNEIRTRQLAEFCAFKLMSSYRGEHGISVVEHGTGFWI